MAALLATLSTQLFPLYTSLFVRPERYSALFGLGLLILAWFWLLSVILLLGAEINSYFCRGQRATAGDLARLVHHAQAPVEPRPPKPSADPAQPAKAARQPARATLRRRQRGTAVRPRPSRLRMGGEAAPASRRRDLPSNRFK